MTEALHGVMVRVLRSNVCDASRSSHEVNSAVPSAAINGDPGVDED